MGASNSILLFFVDDDITDAMPRLIETAVEELAAARSWTVEPPEFVDDKDEDGVRTLGGVLLLVPVKDASGRAIDPALDARLLADVEALVERVGALSRELQIDIGFELDHDQIGWIERGVLDESLGVGLIDEWRRVLAERNAT